MIPYGRHYLGQEDIDAVVDVLRGGALTQGPLVEAFEQAVCDYVGARYAVAVSSGTAALHIAAIVAGLGPGKAAVTSPITFVASANAARYVGADVVFSDIDPATVNLCPSTLTKTLADNPQVAAVIPVHFAGLPCDMDAIAAASLAAGAVVIEDAAHALGARYPDGQMVGCCAQSLMTVFSFHPVKAIAAGEGGMVTTNDEAVYRQLLRLRSHGINKGNDPLTIQAQAFTDGIQNPWYYEMRELGFNYRITDIQCALAISQLRKLDTFVSRRRKLVSAYDQAFAEQTLLAPVQHTGRDDSAHHLYVLRLDFEALGQSRAVVMNTLRDQGVGSQVHYLPVPMQPYYRGLGHVPERYPHALDYYQQALSIPLYYRLDDAQQAHVVDQICALSRSGRAALSL